MQATTLHIRLVVLAAVVLTPRISWGWCGMSDEVRAALAPSEQLLVRKFENSVENSRIRARSKAGMDPYGIGRPGPTLSGSSPGYNGALVEFGTLVQRSYLCRTALETQASRSYAGRLAVGSTWTRCLSGDLSLPVSKVTKARLEAAAHGDYGQQQAAIAAILEAAGSGGPVKLAGIPERSEPDEGENRPGKAVRLKKPQRPKPVPPSEPATTATEPVPEFVAIALGTRCPLVFPQFTITTGTVSGRSDLLRRVVPAFRRCPVSEAGVAVGEKLLVREMSAEEFVGVLKIVTAPPDEPPPPGGSGPPNGGRDEATTAGGSAPSEASGCRLKGKVCLSRKGGGDSKSDPPPSASVGISCAGDREIEISTSGDLSLSAGPVTVKLSL
jgi:hypothetical protein